MTDDAELRERTKQTAHLLFHSIGGGVGYETWRSERGEPFPADEA
jgi:hypothetical protein